MPLFIGAISELVRQIRVSNDIEKGITELKNIKDNDILDLIPKSKRTQAQISLKKAELHHLACINSARSQISKVEEEIILLMEKNNEEKKEKLKNEKANKLDVAKLYVSLKKLDKKHSDKAESQRFDSTIKLRKIENDLKSLGVELKNMNSEVLKATDLFESKSQEMLEMSKLLHHRLNDYEIKEHKEKNEILEKQNNLFEKIEYVSYYMFALTLVVLFLLICVIIVLIEIL